MIYIANAFSMNMLSSWRVKDAATETAISVQPIADPLEWLSVHEMAHGTAVSVVGHEQTAPLFSTALKGVLPNAVVTGGDAGTLSSQRSMGCCCWSESLRWFAH